VFGTHKVELDVALEIVIQGSSEILPNQSHHEQQKLKHTAMIMP
jgi:hypothetical protein